MSFSELGKSFSKAVATSVVDEALKTPIREGANIVGQLFNLAASDRSPGALGRGKSFEIQEGEGPTKRIRTKLNEEGVVVPYEISDTIKRDINRNQQYGLGASLAENLYEGSLTDTTRTFGKNAEGKEQTAPKTYFQAQDKYFTDKTGVLGKPFARSLGITDDEYQGYLDSGAKELPGHRGLPTIREDDFSLQVSREKSSENPLLNWAYKNPEAVGHGITYGAPLAAVAGVGLATYFATKPKSDYSVGIGPSTGNSNIDAARASAHYQQQTAQMKFEHQMQLQQARQQAETPGRQNYGKALGLGLPDTLGGNSRDAYNMATSIMSSQTPVYG